MMAGCAWLAEAANAIKEAQASEKALSHEKMPWSLALAEMLRAGIANARNDRASTLASLKSARKGFLAAHMTWHASACDLRIMQLQETEREALKHFVRRKTYRNVCIESEMTRNDIAIARAKELIKKEDDKQRKK